MSVEDDGQSEDSPLPKLSAEDQRRGVRTLGLLMMGFVALLVIVVALEVITNT